MKLKFKQQKFQEDAALAVVRCFEGQTKGYRKDTDRRIVEKGTLFEREEEINIFSNKKIELSESDILKNIQEIQREYGLKTSHSLEDLNFSIEMETGTGKTYVYIKTMYELNKHYGWSKFIVMVPSVAIREGVHKSFQITEDHFQEIYGKKIRYSIYNTNNKSNLINIKNFADTSNIEVIIMNYQAFNVVEDDKKKVSESARKIYQEIDSLNSERPIDIIKRSRPILIIDEPQRFGERAESILSKKVFNQLFILRYSATHKKEYNKIYRLDAIDAFNQKLVKKINVKGIEVIGNTGTNSYLFVDKIEISKDKYPEALIEMEINQGNGINKKIKRVKEKDDLFVISGDNEEKRMQQYKGYIVKEINGLTNQITFLNGLVLSAGQATKNPDEEHVKRIQIRETIRSHIEKERVLFNKGIKVLSLFFIDEVAKYRDYSSLDEKGEYALIFEDEYKNATRELSLFEEAYNQFLTQHKAHEVHNGYFSIDKKGHFVDSKEKKDEEGSDDVSAYDLIMKDKERLLSFEEPTRFIFSHSALREGWDNPNVFQICTLKHSQSTISKRQEIGRGLRICVNAQGDRMDYSVLDREFFDVNKLTVIASESYDTFAKALQKEIVDSLSDRPVKLTQDVLVNRVLKNEKGDKFVFDSQTSLDFIFDLKSKGYLDNNYQVNDKLVSDINEDKYVVPDKLKGFEKAVKDLIESVHSTAKFKATENERDDNVNEAILKPNENFAKAEFQALWKKIKIKTVYEVDFNSDELISKSISAINNQLVVKKVSVLITSGEQKEMIDQQSLKVNESMSKTYTKREDANLLVGSIKYDLVGEICKLTRLTRKSIVKILQGIWPDTFYNFRVNPEDFIKKVSHLINNEKATTLINNITYSKINECYDDDVFTINNFKGSLVENILQVKKHIYDYVKTDSKIERAFAQDLENNDVMVYAKLPSSFSIPTPLGPYNPDWAIVFDTEDYKYIYFIAETKGTMETLQLRESEHKKIEYAKKHFKALGHTDIKYDVIDTYQSLMDKVMR